MCTNCTCHFMCLLQHRYIKHYLDMAILIDEFRRKPSDKYTFFFTFLLIKFDIPTFSHRSFLPVEIRMKSMTVKEDMIHTR